MASTTESVNNDRGHKLSPKGNQAALNQAALIATVRALAPQPATVMARDRALARERARAAQPATITALTPERRQAAQRVLDGNGTVADVRLAFFRDTDENGFYLGELVTRVARAFDQLGRPEGNDQVSVAMSISDGGSP